MLNNQMFECFLTIVNAFKEAFPPKSKIIKNKNVYNIWFTQKPKEMREHLKSLIEMSQYLKSSINIEHFTETKSIKIGITI